MNINNFFKSLDYLKDDFIPKKYFPDGIYDNKYVRRESIIDSNLIITASNEMYLLYYCDDGTKNYIGIDEELDYINQLNGIKIAVPRSKRFNIEFAMHEAFVLFDFFHTKQSNIFFDAKFMANSNIINTLYYLRKGSLNDFKYNLVLTAFENNPIKKDICLAQFNYFVKRYVEFRLKMINSADTHNLPLNIFNRKLKNELSNYCSNTKSDEEDTERSILDKLFHDLIISNLNSFHVKDKKHPRA